MDHKACLELGFDQGERTLWIVMGGKAECSVKEEGVVAQRAIKIGWI